MCYKIFVKLFIKNDVEMPIPKYFINEKAKTLKEREKLLGQILAKLGPQDKDGVNLHCVKYGVKEIKDSISISERCLIDCNLINQQVY